MGNDSDAIKKMHEEQGHEIIEKLQKKIDTTRHNLEASEEIITETPSDVLREKLTEKNVRRQHGIAGIKKEIHDIEKALET